MRRLDPKKKYYPVGLNITGQECLVVGGGRVAERKVRRLLEYGAKVRLVSPALTPLLKHWLGQGFFSYRQGKFTEKLLCKPVLVFAMTDKPILNRRIARAAQRKNVLVNVAKPGKVSTFILPSVLSRASFTVAVSTDARSPQKAKRIREKLEGLL